jgi:dipeptidyl aminopeptidase/acylaminoacyl peptidase
VLAVVDAAVAREPRLDRSRLVLWGHSFGGYGAMAAATQTDRFAAIIAAAGISDLASAWGEFWPRARVAPEDGLALRARAGWAEQGQGQMGASPWSAPDRYIRNSPLFAADRIVTPLLLIHGDADVVPISQAELMFSALSRQNRDVRLVTYWGEGHLVTSPANVRDLYTQIFSFLDRVLPPAAGPAPGGRPPKPAPSSRWPGPP